jgi:hypothetical protein
MSNEHIDNLVAARTELVKVRRDLAGSLAGEYRSGSTEMWAEQFRNIQATLSAIESAIQHEESGRPSVYEERGIQSL